MAYQAAQSSSASSSVHYFNSPFGDTTYTKVFVGGLAWETHSETLRMYFEQFGDILEAVVITDKNTGRSKGYGFVTFREAECARRACLDPSPVIDGRRANCNLASLGRHQPLVPYGRLGPVTPFIGNVPAPRGSLVLGPYGYQQQVPYSYQTGYRHQQYPMYGPEYIYSQGAYNPYVAQQYFQMYGVPGPGSVNTGIYPPYGQMGQANPGARGFTGMPVYPMPGHQGLSFGGPSGNIMTTQPLPSPQGVDYPVPMQPHFVVPNNSQFMQGGSSNQKTG